mmetsp:Transcript_27041/g.46629  ORF Transcript_27041/g.46629 Transcript_27041/m.46629 type:complete len:111 (+) Transcript_27041:254-586(+)
MNGEVPGQVPENAILADFQAAMIAHLRGENSNLQGENSNLQARNAILEAEIQVLRRRDKDKLKKHGMLKLLWSNLFGCQFVRPLTDERRYLLSPETNIHEDRFSRSYPEL